MANEKKKHSTLPVTELNIPMPEVKPPKKDHTRGKILEALNVIKGVCDECFDDCTLCPLYDASGECGIQNLAPCNWKINKPDDLVWRALL